MIAYYINVLLVSSIFIGIYHAFLQKEKMHQFNRFYLLLSLIVSLVIPLVEFEIQATDIAQIESIDIPYPTYAAENVEVIQKDDTKSLEIELLSIGLALYITVSVFLLVQFIVSQMIMLSKLRGTEQKKYQHAKLILTKHSQTPFTYLKYIFVNKQAYEDGLIAEQIIDHEMAHAKQKHTLDILLVELLLTCCWVNPIFYLFKAAIRLNHEFLADDEVIKKHANTIDYKKLIVQYIASENKPLFAERLSSPFNFLKTKTRLNMIGKKRFPKRILLKQFFIIPVLVLVTWIFSKKTVGQETGSETNYELVDVTSTSQTNQPDTEAELQKAFDKAIEPYLGLDENGKKKINQISRYEVGKDEKDALIDTYYKMSKAQQNRQEVVIFLCKPTEKKVPTKTEFEAWKDPKIYGIWIDDVRVNNDVLGNYSFTDFAHFYKSKLAKNATNYGKHVYQLDLTTNKKFEAKLKTLNGNKIYDVFPRINVKR